MSYQRIARWRCFSVCWSVCPCYRFDRASFIRIRDFAAARSFATCRLNSNQRCWPARSAAKMVAPARFAAVAKVIVRPTPSRTAPRSRWQSSRRYLRGKDGSAQLIQAYQNWLAYSHEMNMKAGNYQPHEGPPIHFQAQYMAGATLRTLCWWAENDFLHTPGEMATMLYEMTFQEPVPN